MGCSTSKPHVEIDIHEPDCIDVVERDPWMWRTSFTINDFSKYQRYEAPSLVKGPPVCTTWVQSYKNTEFEVRINLVVDYENKKVYLKMAQICRSSLIWGTFLKYHFSEIENLSGTLQKLDKLGSKNSLGTYDMPKNLIL